MYLLQVIDFIIIFKLIVLFLFLGGSRGIGKEIVI